jgi:hypothetical protein
MSRAIPLLPCVSQRHPIGRPLSLIKETKGSQCLHHQGKAVQEEAISPLFLDHLALMMGVIVSFETQATVY